MSRRRNGFTLMEVTLASGLTAFLAVVLSSTWVLLSRSTSDLIAWGQLFQEIDIAVATLGRDLGGSQPDGRDADNQLGGKTFGRLIAVRRDPDYTDRLQLCFDGGTDPDGAAAWTSPTDDTIIEYYVDGSRLIRKNQKDNTSFTVAKNLSGMTLTPVSVGGADGLQIDWTFTFFVKGTDTTLTRNCTLIAKTTP